MYGPTADPYPKRSVTSPPSGNERSCAKDYRRGYKDFHDRYYDLGVPHEPCAPRPKDWVSHDRAELWFFEKGEQTGLSKQVGLDRLAKGEVYEPWNAAYKGRAMGRKKLRWAKDIHFFSDPYVAADEIRLGWAYTYAQICKPLQDWAAALQEPKQRAYKVVLKAEMEAESSADVEAKPENAKSEAKAEEAEEKPPEEPKPPVDLAAKLEAALLNDNGPKSAPEF